MGQHFTPPGGMRFGPDSPRGRPGDGGGPPSRGKAALFQILGNYASPGRLAGGAEGNVVYSLSNPYLSMR